LLVQQHSVKDRGVQNSVMSYEPFWPGYNGSGMTRSKEKHRQKIWTWHGQNKNMD